MPALSPARQSLLLFLLAAAVLFPGLWAATGLTGKDEFFLGLRTPMEMMAGDHWLVPFLDGAPRIRKPPLLYWLGRASYELFGVSLLSARLVTLGFASLFVVAAAGIARHLTGRAQTAWLTAGILLGCLGLASEGRRFMLDVPVAALSLAAFWSLLAWLENGRMRQLTATTLLLAAGFLTKGPIVALIFGGGILALLASGRLPFARLRPQAAALAGHAVLWAALALPWFFIVRLRYPEAASLVLADELESRQFFNLSPGIVLGLLNIALPWVFVFALAAGRAWHAGSLPRLALVWFLATFLPFLFIKSFDRYLIGSLAPLALLIAITLPTALPGMRARWPFRLGAVLAVTLVAGLSAFAFWFGLDGWAWGIPPALYLLRAWWTPRLNGHLLAAPALLWLALLAGTFPALGVNAVPEEIVALGRSRPLAFYLGPQPAMLPILSGQPHRHYARLDAADLTRLAADATPVFVEEKDISAFQSTLTASGHSARPLGSYRSLATHGSGLRFARVGATAADWRAAFDQRSLAPLMTTVTWFEITPR